MTKRYKLLDNLPKKWSEYVGATGAESATAPTWVNSVVLELDPEHASGPLGARIEVRKKHVEEIGEEEPHASS
jgi:hypothetical protein